MGLKLHTYAEGNNACMTYKLMYLRQGWAHINDTNQKVRQSV